VEEVLRIVLGLDLSESRVVRAIRGRHRIAGLVVVQVVEGSRYFRIIPDKGTAA
jgi:hypothetical protein